MDQLISVLKGDAGTVANGRALNDHTDHVSHAESGGVEEARRDQQRVANKPAIELLGAFLRGDEAEQTRAWEYLKVALDEDRPEGSKLFPGCSR